MWRPLEKAKTKERFSEKGLLVDHTIIMPSRLSKNQQQGLFDTTGI
jgi:hypothetical protein